MIDSKSLKKFDDGKVMLDLIEPDFVIGIGEVLTVGAQKYGIDNWKRLQKDDIRRYKAAMLRHIYSYLNGEKNDSETCISHLLHAATNIMFLHHFEKEMK